MNRTVVVGVAAGVALVSLAVASVLGGRRGQVSSPSDPVGAALPGAVAAAAGNPLGSQTAELMLPARTKGSSQAPIVIYEVSDFQCPFCRQFWAETLPALEREYINTGKVRFTFLNFPIPQLHANAQAAHEAAMCAAEQDRFWQMHDLLYQHQAAWAKLPDPRPYFLDLALQAQANRGAVEACLASGRIRSLVQGEAQASANAGVRSTPSFIVQGLLLAGSAPITSFRPILDSIFAERAEQR